MREEKPRCEKCTYDTRCDPVSAVSKCLYCGNYPLPKATLQVAEKQK